jgi:hypothetical protein
MPMQAESLEVLERASVAPAQARAIVRAIEIEIAGAKDSLATKYDVLALQQQIDLLRGEITQLGVQLRSEMEQLRAQFRGEMEQLGAQLRGEMAQSASQLRGEIAKLGGDLHAEIHRAVSGSTRQMYVALLGHMAITLGFVYFMITQLR